MWLQKTTPAGLSRLRLVQELGWGRRGLQKLCSPFWGGNLSLFMSFTAQVQNLTAITFQLYLHELDAVTSMKDNLVWDSFGYISKIYSNYMRFCKNEAQKMIFSRPWFNKAQRLKHVIVSLWLDLCTEMKSLHNLYNRHFLLAWLKNGFREIIKERDFSWVKWNLLHRTGRRFMHEVSFACQ